MGPKFLLDSMLGKLTRWLRICGYDTEYVQYIPDDELIQRVADGGRILLTRDRLLYRKAVRAGEEAHLVIGKSDVEKLASVAIRFDLRLDAVCSLCPQCGASLTAVDKHLVSDRVPVRTFEVNDEFWICRSCSKVYWRGSHWRNIQNIVKSAEVMRFSADNGEQPL